MQESNQEVTKAVSLVKMVKIYQCISSSLKLNDDDNDLEFYIPFSITCHIEMLKG